MGQPGGEREKYKNFRLGTWNADGLAERRDELHGYLEDLKLDLLAVQEAYITTASAKRPRKGLNAMGYDIWGKTIKGDIEKLVKQARP